jgi:amino acid transporter
VSSPPRDLAGLLFGRRLRTDEQDAQKISALAGIPVLGLDALSSAAYGPEALLTVLLPLGAAAIGYLAPISAIIIAILLAVFFSYRQTIAAYPNGGGSYTVAKENLGPHAGLLAAAALSLDYILNVAVAIAAGVGQIVSAIPRLLPFTLPLCLVILVALTIVNLRGIREAGLVFMLPTYLFVGTLAVVILIGVAQVALAHGHPIPRVPPPSPVASTAAVSLWLLSRAFASGTTAMTGVEAVSNGVPLFTEPTIKNAQRSLTAIIGILVVLLAGVAYVCIAYGITATAPGATGYDSVLSMMTGAVVGRGWFYFLTMVSVVCVLCLSANTSFADFPRLSRLLALDHYLPLGFAHLGRRLVYSLGVVVLAVFAGILLIVFGGITDALIPLFAVGALLAFTSSQWGMVAHWRRVGGPGARRSLVINGVGAVATSVTLLVVIVCKFTEGAWITAVAIPTLYAIFLGIRSRQERVARELGEEQPDWGPLPIHEAKPPVVIVPITRLDWVSRKALSFAVTISPDVEAVLVQTDDSDTGVDRVEALRAAWGELVHDPCQTCGLEPIKLVTLKSEFREFIPPILRHVRAAAHRHHDRYIAVVVPEVVKRRWYDILLSGHRPTILKSLLRIHGGPRVIIVDAPWHLRQNNRRVDPRRAERRDAGRDQGDANEQSRGTEERGGIVGTHPEEESS